MMTSVPMNIQNEIVQICHIRAARFAWRILHFAASSVAEVLEDVPSGSIVSQQKNKQTMQHQNIAFKTALTSSKMEYSEPQVLPLVTEVNLRDDDCFGFVVHSSRVSADPIVHYDTDPPVGGCCAVFQISDHGCLVTVDGDLPAVRLVDPAVNSQNLDGPTSSRGRLELTLDC